MASLRSQTMDLAVTCGDELCHLCDVVLIDDCRASQEIIRLDQTVLEVMREQKHGHISAPELLLIDSEGLPAVLNRLERL